MVNPVCQKNYTESAGPLQFKNFVNKFMKGGKEKEETKPVMKYHRESAGNLHRAASSGPKNQPKK